MIHIIIHALPYELNALEQTLIQLKRSSQYLNENHKDITNDQLTAVLDNALANNSANIKTLPSKKHKNIIKNN